MLKMLLCHCSILWEGNLPGLYALVFFCMNATQHLAHIHFDGLVWMPPSVSLSRWHDVQNLKLMIFCILSCSQGCVLIDKHPAHDSESMVLV